MQGTEIQKIASSCRSKSRIDNQPEDYFQEIRYSGRQCQTPTNIPTTQDSSSVSDDEEVPSSSIKFYGSLTPFIKPSAKEKSSDKISNSCLDTGRKGCTRRHQIEVDLNGSPCLRQPLIHNYESIL